jgi:hypothetical protein
LEVEQQRQQALTVAKRLETENLAMRSQFNDTLATLQNRVWTISGSVAKLTVGEFDRNARTWPFTVTSADPYVPMVPVPVVAELARASDPRAAILALDTAVKAGALAAEIDWGISRDVANKRYAVDVRAVRVRNLTNGDVVASAQPRQRAAYFTTGRRNNPTAAVGTLNVSTTVSAAKGELFVNGQSLGPLPYRGSIAEGSYSLEVKWSAGNAMPFKQAINIAPGATVSLNATTLLIALGKPGPAGGLVFYDKGNYSDGWRYLEAAPTDTHAGIQWYNGNNIDIKGTGTAVGTGKANTAAIIAAQGSGSYAAMLCRNLSLGGFSDWFLPSKGELNLMYQNLKKANLGGFGSGWYWSSSQYLNHDAWKQRFSDGDQVDDYKGSKNAVRAVRAF